MALPISPLAPARLEALTPLAGVKIAAGHAGIRYKDRPDMLLALCEEGTQVAGVFTRSLTAAAPIDWCRTALANGAPRALLVNAGNANAFTGAAGIHSVQHSCEAVADMLGLKPAEVLMASTGVIGEPLPDAKIIATVPDLVRSLRPNGWDEAAASILTTDTFKKTARLTVDLDGQEVTLQGFAKGSGMIAPDMATMLAFLFTDAAIDAPVLQHCLRAANEQSFNAITVDSDTSTNDCAFLFATGKAGNKAITRLDDPRVAAFQAALNQLMRDLAILIVRDGEGASKLIEITVTGAESAQAAKRIALSIGNSPLVKTAIAGQDANWGRIVAAVGKAGERAERDKLEVRIGAMGKDLILVACNGAVNPDYREAEIMPAMRGQEIAIRVDVGVGAASFTAYSCDFTEGYIKINGSYRS